MLHVFPDTCVWLDFAQDLKQSTLFGMFEEMLDGDQFRQLLPRLVVDESKRSRGRIAKASEAGRTTQIGAVKETIMRTIHEGPELEKALQLLSDVDFKIPQLGGHAARKDLGKGNYDPCSDFEWGMLNGKLSALR